MKKLQLILFFIFLSFPICLTLPATPLKGDPTWVEKKVNIAGKILNYQNHPEHQTIQFIFRDLFAREKTYTATINSDGNFKTSFLLPYAQEFYLQFGKLTSLFLSPGDSLFLEVDADIWNNRSNPKPNGKYYIQAKGGSATEFNQNILKFLDELPDAEYSGNNYNNAVKTKSAEDYRYYVYTREKGYRDFLKKFTKANKTDKAFRNWVDKRLKFETWNDLMRYPWYHSHLIGIKKDSLKLPPNYYSFLDTYDMNDRNINTISQTDFLHEFINYALTKKNKADLTLVQKIEQNSSGFTQQLVFTYLFVHILEAQHLAAFEADYTPALVTDPYLQKRIISEYENLKAFLANKNTKGANLVNIQSTITAQLLQTISSKYKGKVIYIDFWGPWCSPCMQEMPYFKEMQEYFKGKEVVFLFLANRTKDDSWKATIANKELTGEHINLTDDQFNILTSEFDIAGVPHYTLINKEGEVYLKKAPRPSEKELLKKEIENLLK